MPTCQNCKNKWSWSQTMKQQMKLKSKITCDYCGKRQYLSEKSQFKHAVLSFMVMLILIWIFNKSDAAFVLNIVFFIIGITVMSITSPFLTELSNEKEQL
ncbi:TIGR04104 family putative zinc finger protein [Halobacillus karajensis]|uniref:Cxxc_20_cxxc protein n=1 Tax=Halobacillus karajensis TaxID=195088 RepID=A0A024P8C0_9BACI|nr:TIGR04104 family putative zinc finger protein [Halobacillus karajensis]CDQ20244.1 cxxc_20_cxxc protein [Halobacillus karajensis]CDQ25093.1 cxxc_20_cxxc protein [Halobacillus karajensis]CDQ28546.1 cxxc_20_cxxc protein [Halobacillus karajensis]